MKGRKSPMRTDFQYLLVQQDGGVLTLTMNRPEVYNAFNETMLDELGEAVEAFARIGLVPDASGGFFLPRLVGFGKALELAMLAEEVSGPEAERIGLVNKCVPVAEFEATTKAFAQKLANGPTRAYGLIKELMNKSLESDLATTLRL